MANITKETKQFKVGFTTELGKDFALTIDRPDTDKTDAEMFSAVNDFKNCGIIKPDGTSLATIDYIRMVETVTVAYDVEALENE